MPKISIITPTFNRKDTLIKNIESVFSQKIMDMEHIIVDNMSSDGTDELVSDYQKEASYHVIYVREKDNGIYNAMNKGIKIAKGEWVHILNSDDRYKNDGVLNNILKQDIGKYDVLATGIEYEKDGIKKIWKPEIDEKRKHHNFPHPGVFIKRGFYDESGFYSEKFKMVSDAVFMAVNFPKARIRILDLVSVVMLGQGLSSKISLRNLWERFITVMYYHKFPISYKIRLFLYMLSDFRRGYLIWPTRETKNTNRKIS